MAALEMVAARHGVALAEEGRQAVRDGMRRLPPHPEIRQSLERLRGAGLRLATLTNSTAEVGEAQLVNAGLRDLFELALSADAVRRLKPAPQPYRMAAERLDVEPGDVRLVAAHAWDVAGALRAGLRDGVRGAARQGARPVGPEAGHRRGRPARGGRPDPRGRTVTPGSGRPVSSEGVRSGRLGREEYRRARRSGPSGSETAA
jgi:2-haloacid dehalogenase